MGLYFEHLLSVVLLGIFLCGSQLDAIGLQREALVNVNGNTALEVLEKGTA